MKKLYMAVTPDEYELPLAVADTIVELARLTKREPSNIRSAMAHQLKGTVMGMRFVRVEVDK